MARKIPCRNTPQNLIALHPFDEKSDWYKHSPKPVKHESPKILKPCNYKRALKFNSLSAAGAGL